MSKLAAGSIAGALLLAAAPSFAQDQEPITVVMGSGKSPPAAGAANGSEAEAMSVMAKMFAVEPLTAEQRARLPQAEALIAQIMPPGTLEEVMGGMYGKFLDPISALTNKPDAMRIAIELGIEDEDFDIAEAEAEQAAAILDPAWKERGELTTKAMKNAMAKAMRAMEPAMRKGMAEAYAATFTAAEMTDVAAFFATPSGSSYARKSYSLVSDPRIMSASMEAMPALMAEMKAMETAMASATAGLPPKRTFGDLSPSERATLSRLTGRSLAQLRDGMARAEKRDTGVGVDEDDT